MPHPSPARGIVSAAALLTAALFTAPLSAQTTVASTLGPGGSFSAGTGYVIGSDAPGVNYQREVATSFTYAGPAGFQLFDLGLALRNPIAPSVPAYYAINFRRGSNFESSTSLASWAFGVGGSATGYEMRYFDFGNVIDLLAGETYWIHVSGFADGVGAWAQSDPAISPTPGQFIRRDQENNPDWTNWSSPLPAYEVRATGAPVGVPEPAMASLLLVAAVPLIVRARRRA
jgi:hypothetical protein